MSKPDQDIAEALRVLRLKLAGTENSSAIGTISSAATKLAQQTDDPAQLLAVADLIDHCHDKLSRLRVHQPKHSPQQPHVLPIKMRISMWQKDESGVLSRLITNEETPAA